jgi:hypothetical protein
VDLDIIGDRPHSGDPLGDMFSGPLLRQAPHLTRERHDAIHDRDADLGGIDAGFLRSSSMISRCNSLFCFIALSFRCH